MDLGLKGKYALVTGGTHGIGLAIALELAGEGCNVAVCSRTKERVDNAVELIRKKGVDSIGEVVDVLNPNDIDRMIDIIFSEWGGVSILVNNVGGGGRWGSTDVITTDESVWMDVYNKNAMAAVRFTMGFLPFMRKMRWGRVVTITSIFGREGGGRPWFNMAKSA
ncbi:MAG: SDR family NAD(P)-dependent oxidoreductase, partial [Gammaproteobacteria bacterium]|nr:SDR family NAD(P)-dependent oxidoreductase [Gammaproteobacteria bacterium]